MHDNNSRYALGATLVSPFSPSPFPAMAQVDPDAVLVFGSVVLVTAMVLAYSLIVKWMNRNKGAGPDRMALAAIEERLGRIEQGVDSMAIEVERISEGQRFTTKLLAERPLERIPIAVPAPQSVAVDPGRPSA
jgi:hypothetical protein